MLLQTYPLQSRPFIHVKIALTYRHKNAVQGKLVVKDNKISKYYRWYSVQIQVSMRKLSYLITVVEIGISKTNGYQVLGPIFLESTIPGVFQTDFREFADFHPSEKLDQNQFLEVIFTSWVKLRC